MNKVKAAREYVEHIRISRGFYGWNYSSRCEEDIIIFLSYNDLAVSIRNKYAVFFIILTGRFHEIWEYLIYRDWINLPSLSPKRKFLKAASKELVTYADG